LLRYSLPYKHHLLRACVASAPIPRSLFYPRWWLNGPLISKAFIPWKPQYLESTPAVYTSQRLNNITATGLQVLSARDNLTGLAKARFDSQLIKTNKALLQFAGQITNDDLLLTRLPDKVKKPKWAKPRKSHGQASARSYTGAEAAEIAVNRAEQSSKVTGTEANQLNIPETASDEDIIVPGTPSIGGESQGGTTITLAIRTPERLRGPSDLIPTLTSEPEDSPKPQAQPPASTAPARIEEGGARKRRRLPNKLFINS
jgi:hypothetical protein